ncbi:MAG: oligopeptide/dipeptide ABC transporter ATP-binding protein [Alphaproteobacteria bacterium]
MSASVHAGRGEEIIRVNDLRILFPTGKRRETVKAVDGVSFSVMRGETLGIIGESGSGKTTIGRALVALVSPTDGEILYDGVSLASLSSRDLRERRRDFQIVFQDPNAALNPRLKILDSVMEPLQIIGGHDKAYYRRCSLEALNRVGLPCEFAERYPHQLSGGQKQRVNIARVLTVRPRVIVCDEVVAALDVSIRGDILNLFADLQSEFGLTYIFITHDLSVVAHISDRVAVTYLGRFMEVGGTDEVTNKPLHPYSEALMSAEPVPLPSYMRKTKRLQLRGEIPSPIDPPSGCRFRTRCPYSQQRCEFEIPKLRELRPGHWVACHLATTDGSPSELPAIFVPTNQPSQ